VEAQGGEVARGCRTSGKGCRSLRWFGMASARGGIRESRGTKSGTWPVYGPQGGEGRWYGGWQGGGFRECCDLFSDWLGVSIPALPGGSKTKAQTNGFPKAAPPQVHRCQARRLGRSAPEQTDYAEGSAEAANRRLEMDDGRGCSMLDAGCWMPDTGCRGVGGGGRIPGLAESDASLRVTRGGRESEQVGLLCLPRVVPAAVGIQSMPPLTPTSACGFHSVQGDTNFADRFGNSHIGPLGE
jgi:hypothetical protein